MKRIASLIALIALAPLMMAATPSGDEVCAKATAAERSDCAKAMNELSTIMSEEEWKAFSGCLLKNDPLTQENAADCFTPELQKSLEEKMMKLMQEDGIPGGHDDHAGHEH